MLDVSPPWRQAAAAVAGTIRRDPRKQIGEPGPCASAIRGPRQRQCRRSRLEERHHKQLPAGLFERKRDIESAEPLATLTSATTVVTHSDLMISRHASGSISAAAARNVRSRFAPP